MHAMQENSFGIFFAVTKRLLFYGFLVVSMILVGKSGKSQANIIETGFYSINDGLSDRLITDILESSNGLLWMATPSGLNLFDGYEFTIFNDHPNNNNQISASNIEQIEELSSGEILIKYTNNVVFVDALDPRSMNVRKISLLPEDGVKGRIRDLHVNPNQQLLILTQTDTSYHIYELKDKERFQLRIEVPFPLKNRILHTSFLQCFNGDYLINNNVDGMLWLDPTGNLKKQFNKNHFRSPIYPTGYPSKTNFLHQSKDSTIWVAFSKVSGVFKIDRKNEQIRQFSKLTNRKTFFRIWEDDHDHLIIEQGKGVGRPPRAERLYYLDKNQEVTLFQKVLDKRDIIGDIYSRNFAKNLFIGHDTGLRVLQNNQAKVKNFLSQDLEFNDRGIMINGITGDQEGNVYFTRNNGPIYHLDLFTDEAQPLQLTHKLTRRPFNLGNPIDLIYEKDTSTLWAITAPTSSRGNLIKIDLGNCTTTPYTFQNQFLGFVKSKVDSLFWLICETNNNRGKLVAFNPVDHQFTTFFDHTDDNPLKNAPPRYIMEASNGLLWVGTENGLYAINRDSATSTHYAKSEQNKSDGLTSNSIYVIHEDHNGFIWLGTSNGLNILDPRNGAVETYDNSHGLASNVIYGISPTENGNYWITTNNGLSLFNYANRQFRNFYQLDGLSHDEFRRLSFYRDEHGRAYFGGVNGLNAFNTKDLLETNDAPEIVLTKFIRFNSRQEEPEVVNKELDKLEAVSISPFDTYFQFHFVFPNYTRPLKNQFRVWLKGFDKDWVYLGNTPSVRYNKLPQGFYTLLIDGAGPNGNWSGSPKSIRIRVRPIFYKTWWFILLSIFAASGLLYAIFQYQLDQRIKVERIRMKLSSDLHDEMSGLLSGIAMQSDILQMMSTDKESQSRLKIIGEVSRKAMSKMSDVIWSIDSRKDRIADLIQRMREHADDILIPLDIQYQFDIQKIDESHRMPVTIRQNLYFIYKEAINNVAKHSTASLVKIFFGFQQNTFHMTIQDNGTQRSDPIPKSGQGLSNLKMRADRIKADLQILNENGYTIDVSMKKFPKNRSKKGLLLSKYKPLQRTP